jgi:hypothetical protein
MDVLYYWKDINADIKAGRIGWFRSTQERLSEFDASFPDFIWVFKTPKGEKGKLQLLARVAWSSKSPPLRAVQPGDKVLRYDPEDRNSVWFVDTDREDAVVTVSHWMQRHFPAAVRANFQGINGQQPLRGAVLHELTVIAAGFEVRPFSSMVPSPKSE